MSLLGLQSIERCRFACCCCDRGGVPGSGDGVLGPAVSPGEARSLFDEYTRYRQGKPRT